jgi:hypothetical protein
MKITYVIIACFIYTTSLFGQTNPSTQKGTYFTVNAKDYFERVIKPWKFQFTPANNSRDSIRKIGKIIFWRSSPVFDSVSKQYWKPDISFDIFPAADSLHCINLSGRIKSLSSCDSINSGGNAYLIGHFILLSTSSCVNCSSADNKDYCTTIVRRILQSVTHTDSYNWNRILKQFIIEKATFKG